MMGWYSCCKSNFLMTGSTDQKFSTLKEGGQDASQSSGLRAIFYAGTTDPAPFSVRSLALPLLYVAILDPTSVSRSSVYV